MKRAIIQAATLSVICPHCGYDQPSPGAGGESDTWTPGEVKEADSHIRRCVSCDEQFAIIQQNRVSVENTFDRGY